jgi:hypothetical protein
VRGSAAVPPQFAEARAVNYSTRGTSRNPRENDAGEKVVDEGGQIVLTVPLPEVMLLERFADCLELGVQVVADHGQHADDHDGNQRGDKAVFDGGGTELSAGLGPG